MTRKELIDAIIEHDLYDQDDTAYALAEMLRHGFRGYEKFSDEELKNELAAYYAAADAAEAADAAYRAADEAADAAYRAADETADIALTAADDAAYRAAAALAAAARTNERKPQ